MIVNGRYLFFESLKVAPNLLKGSVTLLKSLRLKLLSPINLISLSELTNNPKINLPKVPEFLASIVKFLLNFKPLMPLP